MGVGMVYEKVYALSTFVSSKSSVQTNKTWIYPALDANIALGLVNQHIHNIYYDTLKSSVYFAHNKVENSLFLARRYN